MSPQAGLYAVFAGLILLTAGWFPEVVTTPPWVSGTFDQPSDVAFDPSGRLEVLDQGGRRVATVDDQGLLVAYRAVDLDGLGASRTADAFEGGSEAWAQGLDGARFEAVAQGAGGTAFLDPWSSTVLWLRPQGPLVLTGVGVPWTFRLLVAGWDFLALGLALALAAAVARVLWRWWLKPGPLGPRAALLLVLLLAGVAAGGNFLVHRASETLDLRLRARDMELAAHQAARAADDPYQYIQYRLEGAGLVPRPRSVPYRHYWAALRQDRSVTSITEAPGGDRISVLVPEGPPGEPTGLVEVVWTEGSEAWLPPNVGTQTIWAGLLGLTFYGGSLAFLWTLRRRRGPEPVPFDDQDPLRAHAPGRWVALLGPDVLASLGHGHGLGRRATLVTWASGDDGSWARHLGDRGGLEVPTPGNLRRVLFVGGPHNLAEALAQWRPDQGPLPEFRVQAVRVRIGFVDTAFRFVPLVEGLPPASAEPPGADEATIRAWPRKRRFANRETTP